MIVLRQRDRRRLKVLSRLADDVTASLELREIARQAIALVLEPYPAARRATLFESAFVRRGRRGRAVASPAPVVLHTLALAGETEERPHG